MKQKDLKPRYRLWMLVPGCLGLLLGASLVAAQGNEEQLAANVSSKVETYLGERVVSILAKTTKAQAFRVDPKAREDWPKGAATELDKDSAIKLRTILLDENTYKWAGGVPAGSRCIFEPGVAYRFTRDKESVSVLVCFKCSEVLFVSDNPDDKEDPFRRPVTAKLQPEVVRLTKQVFPNDAVIQSLKE